MAYLLRCWSIGERLGACASSAAAMRWLTVCAVVLLSSCKTDTVRLRPGAPVFILRAKGELQVAAWDTETSTLAEYGWIDASSAVGLTLVDFDWSAER